MKKITKGLIILCFLVFASQGIFAQNSDFAIMGKAWGGLNTWPLGTLLTDALKGDLDSNVDLKAYGFSFGGELLFLDPEGFQVGIGLAYLPIISLAIKESGSGYTAQFNGTTSLIPLTADVVFNAGNFYTNLGLGIGWVKAKLKVSTSGSVPPEVQQDIDDMNREIKNFDIGTVFLVKVGTGFNIPVWQNLAIDFGAALYIPFSSQFNEIGEEMSPFLISLLFSQINLRLGVSYYF